MSSESLDVSFGAEWLPCAQFGVVKRYKVVLPERQEPIYLTHREAMIVTLMMIGNRAKQIAWKLKISLHTVNTHIANIKQKLDCSTNFEVGYRLGWFKLYNQLADLGYGRE